jgi:hypothetical protein
MCSIAKINNKQEDKLAKTLDGGIHWTEAFRQVKNESIIDKHGEKWTRRTALVWIRNSDRYPWRYPTSPDIPNENGELPPTISELNSKKSAKERFFDRVIKNLDEILDIDKDCEMIINGANPYKLIKKEGEVSFEYKGGFGWPVNYSICSKEKFREYLSQSYH